VRLPLKVAFTFWGVAAAILIMAILIMAMTA
jgi:hypothetical protein